MLKIGSLTLKSKLILAPLSGTSDMPFRVIARAHGCSFAFFEMLDSSGLAHGHKRTLSMLDSCSGDEPIGAQVLGSDPGQVLEACHIILAHSKPVLMDLNCACPATKVIKKRCGSRLLKEPKLAAKIFKKLASLPLPFTVKVRQGWGRNHASEGLKLAKIAQENGASAIFFHGRSVSQGYAGKVDYEAISEAKRALKIPVLASGDVLSPVLAKEMLDRTNCDGLLVARGAMGTPWIFRQIESFLSDENNPLFEPSYADIISTAKDHLRLYMDYKNGAWQGQKEPENRPKKRLIKTGSKLAPSIAEKYYLGHMRKIAMWYTKGLPYSKRAREALSKARSCNEIMGVLGRLNRDYDSSWFRK